METIDDKMFFWADSEDGYSAEGGYYIRNDMKDFFKKLIESGKIPVGIVIDMDSYNVEVLIKCDMTKSK